MMRTMMRTAAPLVTPATTGTGTEDLPPEWGWGRSVALLVGGGFSVDELEDKTDGV